MLHQTFIQTKGCCNDLQQPFLFLKEKASYYSTQLEIITRILKKRFLLVTKLIFY